jgi:ABC-2 type transport system permease protein
MIQQVRAEFKKLLTVRSTYIVSLTVTLFLGFISFWVAGYKNNDIHNPHFLTDGNGIIAPLLAIASAIVAVLLMAHEYRYNTIVHTLSLTNRRSKVMAAKIAVTFVYTLLLTIIIGALSLVVAWWGNKLGGHALPKQTFDAVNFFGKMIFFTEGFALAALMFTALIRNLVASIVFILIVPNTIESLLGLVLKKNAVYLPFTALGQVITTSNQRDSGPNTGYLTPAKGALVFGIYLVIGWLITWYLFLRRDAS